MQKVKAERNGNFTVINNYHLHDRNISTCAKALMTLLLSLPEDWVLSVRGVSKILNETEYAVRKMMRELEACGYLKKEKKKDENGRYAGMEYTVYELPYREEPEQPAQDAEPSAEPAAYPAQGAEEPSEEEKPSGERSQKDTAEQGAKKPSDEPLVGFQQAVSPHTVEPFGEKPRAEILSLQNTKYNKILNNNPIHPYPLYPCGGAGTDTEDKQRAHSEREQNTPLSRQVKPSGSDRACGGKPAAMPPREIYRRYRELILSNIAYDSLKISAPYDIDTVDGLVELMLEVLCGTKPHIRISGTDHPQELVKARFLKLEYSHMLYILDCLRENTSDVRNVKQYLLAVLFNAAATMEGYYTLKIGHDFAAGLKEQTS